MSGRNKLADIPGKPLPERQSNLLADLWDEATGAFARYGRRSGAQRDASLAMLNQAVDPNTDPLTGAGMKALGLAGLVTHPLAFFPTREEWDQRLEASGNDGRMSRSIGGFLSDLPSLIDPQMAAGGAALAAAPLVGKLAKPGLGKGLGDLMQDAASNKELDALGARLQAEAAQVGSVPVPLQGFVARNAGENVGSAEVSGITRPNSLYRGMTQSEYDATFGSGGGVGSRGDFSTLNEGTSFADDAGTAESYVNFGRDDPRKTGKPTYLVEIDGTNGAQRTPDGYYKAASTIGRDRVARVFEMTAAPDGSIVARDISSPSTVSRDKALQGLVDQPQRRQLTTQSYKETLPDGTERWVPGTLRSNPTTAPRFEPSMSVADIRRYIEQFGEPPPPRAKGEIVTGKRKDVYPDGTVTPVPGLLRTKRPDSK
jgi:hypothetical protein